MTSVSFPRRALLGAAGASLLPRPGRAQPAAASPVLRVVSPWEYTSDDPADTGFLHHRLGIAETLVEVEPDGRLVGGLAERWAVDADQLTWRFILRSGARFHDGTSVTAEAVAASLRGALGGESLSVVPVADITTTEGAVVIRTRTPFAPLPSFLNDYSSIVLAPSAYGPDGKVARIVATGAFQLTGVDGQSVMTAERFDGYWGQPAKYPRLRHAAVVNGDTRANIAVAGDADLVFTLPPQSVERINAAGPMTVRSLTIPRLRFITMNLGLPQFSDVRVRRALSLAVDRAGIATGILRHPGSAATQLLPPVLSGWYDPALPPLATDLGAARALLDQAGWAPGTAGIRTKDGARLAARMLVPSNRPELPLMAAALQAQWRAVGMELAIDVVQTSSIPEAVRSGTMQMTLIARTYVNVPDPIATVVPDYTRERSVWGTLNWADRGRMQALTDEYVQTFDAGRLATLRQTMTALIHDEMPVIPVSWFEHTVAVSNHVRDAVIDPYEMRYFTHRVSPASA